MGLTGLEIYKKLPQTNCGECGPPTCLAFAMQLAEGKAELSECPDVSDEAKEALAAASKPPIATITIGSGEFEREIGGETELFRHDKTFFNEPGIALTVSDEEDVEAKIEKINALSFERVGQEIEVDMVAVVNDSGDADAFAEAVETVANNSERTLILVSEDAAAMEAALDIAADENPLVYGATSDNWEDLLALAEENDCPLGVKGEDLDNLAELTEQITGEGYENLVIDGGARETAEVVAQQTMIRRLALKKKFRPVGFPTITFTTKEDSQEEAMQASNYIAKYAGIVVLSNVLELAEMMPLLTVRQNIYTDPRVPVTVEPNKVYEIGEPDENSPVFITTNFSLSYYSVEGEVPEDGYIIPVDTDGTSVLTAFSADKFGGAKIAEVMVEETDIEDKVSHRKVIIPGHVAVLSGKLEEESGWDVLVGPREASGIAAFISQRWEEELNS
ncbi:acetyl-CoA decarbonylase/synthase complex subunit gamma [Fuchsiella alkaliacetigena]|uniref:acetyl-CoA decarbonylase/synthase complex subunit gamma n=1 Tax=Fuchsiella alkaliacetigena TaxID=957042 RepID=UPI00200B1EDB|nr:acetyl-CoA decarbonylase/synthase complex subunit gamma [Fuchsiella alkaliacetigena]MCK8823745.1 acetyl-CoA decarbonylase/synthase complex subunit gamma [Fuchsiella alkaliacetigena]